MPKIRPAVAELGPWLVDLRRRLHQCPEPGYGEVKTAALIRAELAALGYDSLGPFGRTGLTAIFDSGRAGATAAFRADMDGLEITEPGAGPWASQNPGFMHACGHDFNMALMLGLARLAALGGLSPALGGRLMFIFQPAEEGGGGAEAMLADGLFTAGSRPDFIFAGHAEPRRPPGRLIINSGPIMAGVLDFHITITGRGGHAGMPHSAVNPLPALGRLATALTGYAPPDGALLALTIVRGGERTNVIPPEAYLAGTARWHTDAARQALKSFVEQTCAGESGRGGLAVELAWRDGYPPTINDPEAAARVREVGQGLLAPGMVTAEKPSFGGEDFSFFLEQVPGVFLFLGTGGPGCNAPLHSPEFQINEEALPLGLEFWARVAEEFLIRSNAPA